MKKLICIILCVLCLAGCAAQTQPEPDDVVLRAMYVPMGDGYVLIDDDGAPFTLSSFEGLSAENLSAGDIVAITNPGDMAASYPGILYGYDRLELVEEGNPEDTIVHRAVLDELMGLSAPDNAPEDAVLPDELCVNRAMYVPYGENDYVMIDDMGQVFTVRFPSDMIGLNGEAIEPDDLVAGNIVEIYGNGVMLESYPGQYPNVERIVVVEAGDPADIEQHRAILDGLYAVPAAPDAPPSMHIEYAIEDAIAYSQVQPGNYSWEQDMGNGETAAVIACGAHVLQSNGLREIFIEQETDVLLTFPAYAPVDVTCIRWPISERRLDGSEVTALGEAVELDLPIEPTGASGSFDLSLRKLTAEPGYVYLVTAQWAEGNAEYGFVAED